MNTKRKIARWSLGSLLGLLLITGIILLWVNLQLARMQGTFTDVIDPTGAFHSQPTLLIKGVQVLSPDATHFIPHRQVLIENGKIKAIQADSLEIEGIPIVQGKGQFLIPGLVDSHVHLKDSKNDLYLYLANGVTGVREMSGNCTHLDWREEIRQGALGPRMYVASEKVNSKEGVDAHFETWTRRRINYATEAQAAEKIKELSENGFDAIKMSSFTNREMYAATIKYADQYQLPVVGHIPYPIGLDSFYHAGQAEVAHIEELTKGMIWKFGGYGPPNAEEFLEYLRQERDSIAIRLRRKGIPVTSTLALMESLPAQKIDMKTAIQGVPIEYVNPNLLEGTPLNKGWLPGNNAYEESTEVQMDPERKKGSLIFWETYVKALHIMLEALREHGVAIHAGTDANVPLMVPGFSLHEELAALAGAGMSPVEVLYAATVAPGEWMQSNTGKIQVGYQADLLLLAQNPLEYIRHTRSVEAVFAGGNWLDQEQIAHLLEAVKAANARSRKLDLEEYVDGKESLVEDSGSSER